MHGGTSRAAQLPDTLRATVSCASAARYSSFAALWPAHSQLIVIASRPSQSPAIDPGKFPVLCRLCAAAAPPCESSRPALASEAGSSLSEPSSKGLCLWKMQQHLLFLRHSSSLSITSSAQRTRRTRLRSLTSRCCGAGAATKASVAAGSCTSVVHVAAAPLAGCDIGAAAAGGWWQRGTFHPSRLSPTEAPAAHLLSAALRPPPPWGQLSGVCEAEGGIEDQSAG